MQTTATYEEIVASLSPAQAEDLPRVMAALGYNRERLIQEFGNLSEQRRFRAYSDLRKRVDATIEASPEQRSYLKDLILQATKVVRDDIEREFLRSYVGLTRSGNQAEVGDAIRHCRDALGITNPTSTMTAAEAVAGLAEMAENEGEDGDSKQDPFTTQS